MTAARSNGLVGGLRGQIARQVVASQQRLQVVGQQQALRAAAVRVVVHDAALEALVDEVVVGRIVGRLADRRAPDLEVEQAQDVRIVGAGDVGADRVEERALEIDRLAVEVS